MTYGPYMFGMIREKLKVFNSIVASNAVDMVHDFFQLKITAQMLLYYKPMFTNINRWMSTI